MKEIKTLADIQDWLESSLSYVVNKFSLDGFFIRKVLHDTPRKPEKLHCICGLVLNGKHEGVSVELGLSDPSGNSVQNIVDMLIYCKRQDILFYKNDDPDVEKILDTWEGE